MCPADVGILNAVSFNREKIRPANAELIYRHRLEQTETDRVARTLSAWSITSNATIALLTALWGFLASIIGPRAAIATAGVLLLATPLLLPRSGGASRHERKPAGAAQDTPQLAAAQS